MNTYRTSFVCLILAVITSAWLWPTPHTVSAQANSAVQMLPPGHQRVAKTGDKGATYYALESQTQHMKVTFHDGSTATSDRTFSGEITTKVHDSSGNERSKMKVLPVDTTRTTISFQATESPDPVQMLSNPASVHHTMDWSAKQAYRFTKDGTKNLVWDKDHMHPKTTHAVDPESEVNEIETVWQDGLVATVRHSTRPRKQVAPGLTLGGRTLETVLMQNGVFAGGSTWFEDDHAYVFKIVGLMTETTVFTEKTMKDNYGGWTFTPDTTWMNLQLIATHHFKTLVAKQGFVAKNDGGCQAGAPTNRIAEFFFPTVHADDVGCDRLHWLDGGIFRGCCDDHDRCYQKHGCTESTWWRPWSSWSCDMCNMDAVWCFYGTAMLDLCYPTRAGYLC